MNDTPRAADDEVRTAALVVVDSDRAVAISLHTAWKPAAGAGRHQVVYFDGTSATRSVVHADEPNLSPLLEWEDDVVRVTAPQVEAEMVLSSSTAFGYPDGFSFGDGLVLEHREHRAVVEGTLAGERFRGVGVADSSVGRRDPYGLLRHIGIGVAATDLDHLLAGVLAIPAGAPFHSPPVQRVIATSDGTSTPTTPFGFQRDTGGAVIGVRAGQDSARVLTRLGTAQVSWLADPVVPSDEATGPLYVTWHTAVTVLSANYGLMAGFIDEGVLAAF